MDESAAPASIPPPLQPDGLIWSYQIKGRVVGNQTLEQIKEAVRNGVVKRRSPIGRSDWQSYKYAFDVPELAWVLNAPVGYLWGKIYGWVCLIGGVGAWLGFIAAFLPDNGSPRFTPGWYGQTIAYVVMGVLYCWTGFAILKKKHVALKLIIWVAVVGGIGLLAHGIRIVDSLLLVPSLSTIPYLRKRSSWLS